MIRSITKTNPMTPVLSTSQNSSLKTKFACPSPSGGSSHAPKKNARCTERTSRANRHLSIMDKRAGLPVQMGVSDSVISGKFALTEPSSISDLKESTWLLTTIDYCDDVLLDEHSV